MDNQQDKPPASNRRHYSSGQEHYISRSVLLEELGPPGGASSLVVLAPSIVLGFIFWASLTSMAETSKALGEIVPGPSVTQVKHLEGGIIGQVRVTDGQLVQQGHVLVTLDPIAIETLLKEITTHKMALTLRHERLLAFAEQRQPHYADIDPRFELLAIRELSILKQQIVALEEDIEVINLQRR